MRGLEGKRIVIAGSATGIGAATARRLAEEGVRLHLGDLNEDDMTRLADELRATGAAVSTTVFDLGDTDSVAMLVAEAAAQLGGLDGVANIAVNTAPEIMGGDIAVAEMDPGVWEAALRVNLIGYALVAKEALPHLIEAGGGSIVNTASAATFIGEDTRPAYAASKSGINALTRHLARAYGKHNVRANSIGPGVVLSENAVKAVTDEFLEQVLATCTLPRLGTPDDIAQGMAFLLSDDASWVTGQAWGINGGMGFRE